MIDNSVEYIVCAAYLFKDDYLMPNIKKINEEGHCDVRDIYYEPHRQVFNIATGWRHCDILYKFGVDCLDQSDSGGFMTSKGRYVNRIEGMRIAFIARQVDFEHSIKTMDDNEMFWDDVDYRLRSWGEDSFTPPLRESVANHVTEWFRLYSEDIY